MGRKSERAHYHLSHFTDDNEKRSSKILFIDVTFEVFTAVTVKNVVFWNIKTQFVPQKENITSPLQSPAR
jgi:hypothetical protein